MLAQIARRVLPYRVRHGLRQIQATLQHREPANNQVRNDAGRSGDQDLAPNVRAIWEETGLKWCMDHVSVAGGNIEIEGWAYVPPGDRDRVGFTWNDRSFESVKYGLTRPDLAQKMPYVDGIGTAGFRCVSPLPAAGLPAGSHVAFRCVDRETARDLIRPSHPYCYVVPASNDVVPEMNRRVRVVGKHPESGFGIGGATVYNQLRRALTRTVGRDITHFEHVLDWGCGCGRVSRYFRPPGALTGVDVDPDNVRWCQQYLDHGRYAPIPIYPPTSFPNGTFDFIFGISVMTHLREGTQALWLEELHRIARPGAIVMLTFHGAASALLCLWPDFRKEWETLQREQIFDMPDRAYDADLGEEGYYRSFFQTTEHIRRNWSKHFQILDLLPCYLFHQDMAVLRKVG